MKKIIILSSFFALIASTFGLANYSKTAITKASSSNSGTIQEDTMNLQNVSQISEEVNSISVETNNKAALLNSFNQYVDNNKTRVFDGESYSVVENNGSYCTAISDEKVDEVSSYGFLFFDKKTYDLYSFMAIYKSDEVEVIKKELPASVVFPNQTSEFEFTYSEGTSYGNSFDVDATLGAGFGGFVSAGIRMGFGQEQETSSEVTISLDYSYTKDFIDSRRTANYVCSIYRASFIVLKLLPDFRSGMSGLQTVITGAYIPTIEKVTVDLYTYFSVYEGGTY